MSVGNEVDESLDAITEALLTGTVRLPDVAVPASVGSPTRRDSDRRRFSTATIAR
jgi:hypothetical protein